MRLKMHLSHVLSFTLIILLSDAYTPVVGRHRKATKLNVLMSPGAFQNFEQDENSYFLEKEKVNALVKLGKGDSEKIINSFGAWCAFVSILTGPIWMMAMTLLNFMNERIENMDPNRALYDKTGKIWAKVWLTLTNSYPTVSGNIEQLLEHQGPCLYVANHASWLDIPVLCTVLDPVFKFIAKGELRKVPCIGQQLAGVSIHSIL